MLARHARTSAVRPRRGHRYPGGRRPRAGSVAERLDCARSPRPWQPPRSSRQAAPTTTGPTHRTRTTRPSTAPTSTTTAAPPPDSHGTPRRHDDHGNPATVGPATRHGTRPTPRDRVRAPGASIPARRVPHGASARATRGFSIGGAGVAHRAGDRDRRARRAVRGVPGRRCPGPRPTGPEDRGGPSPARRAPVPWAGPGTGTPSATGTARPHPAVRPRARGTTPDAPPRSPAGRRPPSGSARGSWPPA
ncbi:hypothetical protein EHYA_10010 [Embleya hyalina]|uniref:Uncharacterized protein n=1 Tax=Embleya hyalina TaxID=516124 RepID=A0A401Z5W2_9ACTN|nr:hypothetical protein EHYA_10010 [Embleya hyalina]